MKRRIISIEIISVVVFFAILASTLLANPIIGMSDNGDFGRMLGLSGLGYTSSNYNEIYDNTVHREYKDYHSVFQIFVPFWGKDWTSGVILAKNAIFLKNIFSNESSFDIRYLSFIYILIFTAGMFLILKYSKPLLSKTALFILAVLLILVFTDAGYISYFNSFFGEAASLAFLIFSIGLALSLLSDSYPKLWKVILFSLSSILFATAKGQNIPLIILIVLFYVRVYFLCNNAATKKVLLTFGILALCLSIAAYASIGDVTNRCNSYQTVFSGVLKDSPTPENDLEELGIDTKYSVLAGTYYFTPGLPYNPQDKSLDKDLYSKISRLRVLRFYLTHPQRLYTKLLVTAKNSFIFNNIDSDNFEKGEYYKNNKLYNSFRIWLSKKYNYVFQSLIFLFLFTLLYFMVLANHHVHAKGSFTKVRAEFFMIIGLFGFSQFFLPILGSGEGDLGKHLFLLNVCYDIMLIIGIVWMVDRLNKTISSLLKQGKNKPVSDGTRA